MTVAQLEEFCRVARMMGAGSQTSVKVITPQGVVKDITGFQSLSAVGCPLIKIG